MCFCQVTIFNTLINYPKVQCLIKSVYHQTLKIATEKPVKQISHTQIHIMFYTYKTVLGEKEVRQFKTQLTGQ